MSVYRLQMISMYVSKSISSLSGHLIEEVLLEPGLAVSVLHQLFVDLQTLE